MELVWIVYVISLLPKIISTATIFLIVGGIMTLSLAMFGTIEENKTGIFYAKVVGVITFLSMLILVFVPSEKTAYTMAGAYVTQQVITHPEVRDMSEDVLAIIKNKLKQYVDESVNELGGQKKNDNQD